MSILRIPLGVPIFAEGDVAHDIRNKVANHLAHFPRWAPFGWVIFVSQSAAKVAYVFEDLILHSFDRLWSQGLDVDPSLESMLLSVDNGQGHIDVTKEMLVRTINLRLLYICVDIIYVS